MTDAESNAYTAGSPMFTALMHDRSCYHCYESLQLTHTATAEHPLVFSDDNAKVAETMFSPNRIEFTVIGGSAPARVSLNQNYAPGWSSTAGAFTPTRAAMPGVTLAPGQTGRFAFVFVPEGLWTGLGIFAVAAALTAFLLRGLYATRG